MEKGYKHPGGKFRRLGPSKCSDKELLSIIINSGTKGMTSDKIAEELIDRFGTIYNIAGKPLNELLKIKGIGAVKATQIAALFELSKRILRYIEKE